MKMLSIIVTLLQRHLSCLPAPRFPSKHHDARVKIAESCAFIADVENLTGERRVIGQGGISHHDIACDVVDANWHNLRVDVAYENKGERARPRQQHFG